MLSSVLRSEQAVLVNIAIMRAFVRLRQFANKHADLAAILEKLECRVRTQGARLDDHAESIKKLFAAIREIMEPPVGPRKQIGFSLKTGERE